MTRLLVSVRNAPEAAIALGAGAHLIDVKEPSRGALGAADFATIAQVVETVAGRVPVSAALGELFANVAHDGERREPIDALPAGVSFAKLGLARAENHENWRELWRERRTQFPNTVQPVAVAYADWRTAGAPPPGEVLEQGTRLGCAGLLVDTFEKSRGGLFDYVRPELLAGLIERAQAANMFVVLAGSLTPESLALAVALEPDFVGVRGAACSGGRGGKISSSRITRLLNQLKLPENTGV